ncbi:GntR family transcriptional regulator (plasmid) [Deinococcus radiomollis]|uniref:GntR family transcriptional regulator n=1 Tax=Deinococcus radiomollis TaxID=468916 RepID=UPI0038922BBC
MTVMGRTTTTLHSEPQLSKLTVAGRVASALREDIASGRLLAGTKLKQVEIAQRFGVSTTPVREAFGMLQSEGLVQIDTHRGVTIFLPTIQDLAEHYEIRTALEVLAVELAARVFAPDDAALLVALLDEMETTTDAGRYVELNSQFHLRLYALTGRSRLLAMIEELRNASNAYVHLYAARDVPRDARRLNDEHREILAACVANDPERAGRAVRQHLGQTVSHVIQVLQENQDR